MPFSGNLTCDLHGQGILGCDWPSGAAETEENQKLINSCWHYVISRFIFFILCIALSFLCPYILESLISLSSYNS